MPSPCVHHIEIGASNGPSVVKILQENFAFNIVATRSSKVAWQWLLVNRSTRYLVTSLKSSQKEDIRDDDYVIDWGDTFNNRRGDGEKPHQRKDSVFNVCLQVDDLDRTLERMRKRGVHPFKKVKSISDSFGSVRICTIKSCVGDVYHTLVEKKDYNGQFLPGFRRVKSPSSSLSGCDFNSGDADEHSPSNMYYRLCSEDFCDNSSVQPEISGRSDCYSNAKTNTMNSTGEGETTSVVGNGVGESSGGNCGGDRDIRNGNDVPNTNTYTDHGLASVGGKDSILSQSQCVDGLEPALTVFDHVALAVEMGMSPGVIDWYETCFGMKRFMINSEEDNDEGLVLSLNDVSLRLRAMEYWKCAETGICGPKVESEGSRFSMVICEGLPPKSGASDIDQIESWLRQHGGPGIQHVALSTQDIKATVGFLQSRGAAFAKSPPLAYYSKAGRLSDIQKAGEDVDTLREYGILIDTEADRNEELDEESGQPLQRYLLQIFTKPILPKDPFFMELIQREGATGFGSGNVAALYRSVHASITEKEKSMA